MKTLTDQLEQLAELQKDNLEPVRRLNEAAFTAFERIARKNYELMGDMVDYAVAQSRGQLEPGTPQQRLERQMSEAKMFAERIGRRASEYAELAGSLREHAVGSAEEADASARQKGAGAAEAAAKAASAPAEATVRAARVVTTETSRAAKKVARAGDDAAHKVVSKKSAAKKKPAGKKRAAKKVAKKSTGKRAAKA